MILAVDVQYAPLDQWARVGVVVFPTWEAPDPTAEFVTIKQDILAYESGAFYKRELPCIVPAIHSALLLHPISILVIDGFVDLADNKPGLGRYLYEELERRYEVIGVAKNGFRGAPATAITRGQSSNPLWVSSTTDHAQSAILIASMAGESRIPLLLKRTDTLARANAQPIEAASPPAAS